jgi:TM2 domain-containing membrane protein YozV
MLQIACNMIIPGLGTLFMKKPLTGILQILLFLVAIPFTLSVFMTAIGLFIWAVDIIWALFVGLIWRYKKKQILR